MPAPASGAVTEREDVRRRLTCSLVITPGREGGRDGAVRMLAIGASVPSWRRSGSSRVALPRRASPPAAARRGAVRTPGQRACRRVNAVRIGDSGFRYQSRHSQGSFRHVRQAPRVCPLHHVALGAWHERCTRRDHRRGLGSALTPAIGGYGLGSAGPRLAALAAVSGRPVRRLMTPNSEQPLRTRNAVSRRTLGTPASSWSDDEHPSLSKGPSGVASQGYKLNAPNAHAPCRVLCAGSHGCKS